MIPTLVLLACLVSSEVAFCNILLMLLALIIHLFRKTLAEERKVGRLATLFLKPPLELLYALLSTLQPLFSSLAVCDSFCLRLLCVRQCATSYKALS